MTSFEAEFCLNLLLDNPQTLVVRSAGSIHTQAVSGEHVARVECSLDGYESVVFLPVDEIELVVIITLK